MMMMGYFRAPRLSGRRSSSSSPERDGLLVGGEGAASATAMAVPKGYFAVYVGAEARRFVVPMSLLCQPAFRALMERAAEEFGFGQAGGLRIPCRVEDFVATVAALDQSSRHRRTRSTGTATPW